MPDNLLTNALDTFPKIKTKVKTEWDSRQERNKKQSKNTKQQSKRETEKKSSGDERRAKIVQFEQKKKKSTTTTILVESENTSATTEAEDIAPEPPSEQPSQLTEEVITPVTTEEQMASGGNMQSIKTEIESQLGEIKNKFDSTGLDEIMNNLKDLKSMMGEEEPDLDGEKKNKCSLSNIRWLIQNGSQQERAIGAVTVGGLLFLMYFILRIVLQTAVFFVINGLLAAAIYIVSHVCLDEFLKHKIAEKKRLQASAVDEAEQEIASSQQVR